MASDPPRADLISDILRENTVRGLKSSQPIRGSLQQRLLRLCTFSASAVPHPSRRCRAPPCGKPSYKESGNYAWKALCCLWWSRARFAVIVPDTFKKNNKTFLRVFWWGREQSRMQSSTPASSRPPTGHGYPKLGRASTPGQAAPHRPGPRAPRSPPGSSAWRAGSPLTYRWPPGGRRLRGRRAARRPAAVRPRGSSLRGSSSKCRVGLRWPLLAARPGLEPLALPAFSRTLLLPPKPSRQAPRTHCLWQDLAPGALGLRAGVLDWSARLGGCTFREREEKLGGLRGVYPRGEAGALGGPHRPYLLFSPASGEWGAEPLRPGRSSQQQQHLCAGGAVLYTHIPRFQPHASNNF